eukprot:5753505-Amphidinium_carterae.1
MEFLWFVQVCCDYSCCLIVADATGAFTQMDVTLQENQRTKKQQGFRMHPMSPSIFLCFECMHIRATTVLSGDPVHQDQLGGVILLQVDDFLMGGVGDKFDAAREHLETRFKFQQLSSRHVLVGMTRAAHTLVPLTIALCRARTATSPATPTEVTAYRGLLGQSDVDCIVQPHKHEASQQIIQHLEATVSDVHRLGIDPAVAGYIPYSDASLANASEQRTHVSMVTGRCNRVELRETGSSSIRLQEFASHKFLVNFRRVVSSTLMAESAAVVEALCAVECLYYIVAWRGYATSLLYHRPTYKMTIELKAIEEGLTHHVMKCWLS